MHDPQLPRPLAYLSQFVLNYKNNQITLALVLLCPWRKTSPSPANNRSKPLENPSCFLISACHCLVFIAICTNLSQRLDICQGSALHAMSCFHSMSQPHLSFLIRFPFHLDFVEIIFFKKWSTLGDHLKAHVSLWQFFKKMTSFFSCKMSV